ncbi:MAG: peptidylprolyl isomerase [Trueperaceae bacterium]|jgi:peptidylprolyl isomerase
MRIFALAVLATIIVVSGIWLARDRSAAPAEPAAGSAAATSTSAPETATDPAPQDPADTADPEEGTAEEAPVTVNGVILPQGYSQVAFLTDVPQQAFDAPTQVLDEALDYVAVIGTNQGAITLELYEDLTPVTVNNFVFLALHRYFEGVPFHRVIEGFMAQTGDPTGTGTGGPGFQFDDEIVESLTFDSEGILAMANAGPGTNGSQFFITFAATPWLDGAHTIFGHVIDGLEVLPEITRVDPSQPSAIVLYTGTVGELAEQGVVLPADEDMTLADALEELLGALPGTGQSFSVAGNRGVAGMLGTDPAFGFYLTPDQIETVVIAARQR